METVILIIMILVKDAQPTISEHKFNSMESCLIAKEQVTSGSFRFGREISAFCVEK